jgi:hypothetical protein
MKKSSTLAFLILALLAFSFALPEVYAATTEIKIKTVPFANINLNVLDSGTSEYSVLQNFNKDANQYGDVTFVYASDESSFDMSIYVKKNNQRLVYEKYSGFTAGETIELLVAPEGAEIFYDPAENATANETANTTLTDSENQAEAAPGITGLAASDDTGEEFSTKYIPYFIAVFLILGLGVFFFMVKKKRMSEGIGKSSKEVRVVKLSDIKSGKAADLYKRTIEDAEKKIVEAQKEINRLKNTEKIDEIKHRMIEDQKELMKLRGDD